MSMIRNVVSICVLVTLWCCSVAAYGAVIYSAPTPDGQYRLEISDRTFAGIFEIHRMLPTDPPGSGVRISGVEMVDWNVSSFTISPDSQTVRFWKSRAGGGCSTGSGGWWLSRVDGTIQMESLQIFCEGFWTVWHTGWSLWVTP